MRVTFAICALLSLLGCAAPQAGTAPRDALKVELVEFPLSVKFTNSGTKPVRILKPVDGSESCWFMPYYKLTVKDQAGREIPRLPRCGMTGFIWSNTKWPDDYLVTVPPGGSFSRPLHVNHDIPKTALYTLCFHYVFRPESNRTPVGRYPRHLWRGELVSNTLDIPLKAVPHER